MGTTPRGIVYPDSDGHTRLWEHLQTLADSVDDAIDAESGGGALVSAWTNMTLIADTGWTVTSARYRVLLDVLVVIDATFTRTGADIVSSAAGNIADTPVAHNLPSAIRPTGTKYLDFMRGSVAAGRISVTGTGALEAVTLAGTATLTSTITVHDSYVLG